MGREADGPGCARWRVYARQALGGAQDRRQLMSLDEIEIVLKGWREPMPNAPARLPWQAGVVAALRDRCHA